MNEQHKAYRRSPSLHRWGVNEVNWPQSEQLKSQRLEAVLDNLSQWRPLMSGPKEKKKKGERKFREAPGPKVNAPHSVCSASMGGPTQLVWSHL